MWGPEVSVPVTVLSTLLVAEATASAHHKLCSGAENDILTKHPGDSLGKVLSWLWSAGRQDDCGRLVADYLAEMRQHNPHAPDEGRRLTWADLEQGIAYALDPRLSERDVEALLTCLRENVPRYYGEAPKRLNAP